MSRAGITMLVALAAAPALAYWVYRLARGLGFLQPPVDREHELRREIVVALYALLISLPVLFYGYEKAWPRAWVVFGVFNGLALVVFAVLGGRAAMRLWKIRHPEPVEPVEPAESSEPAVEANPHPPR